MTAARRALAVLLASVAVLLGLGAPAGAAEETSYAADRVVVLGVPGLVWSDVDPDVMPQTWTLAQESAIGALSVRAARSTTCVLDGWATLGAGNRARWAQAVEPIPPVPLPPDPGAEAQDDLPAAVPDIFGPDTPEDTSLSYCGLQEQVANVGIADPAVAVARVAEDEATARFGAEPGALGDAVPCVSTVGRAASVAAAGPQATLTQVGELPADAAGIAGVVAGCPLTLASLGDLTDAGAPSADETDTGTQPLPRGAALGQVDQAVGAVRAALTTLPGDTLLLVQGVSEVNDGRPQLHVAIANGPGYDGGWLTSASTGRAPFVQLIDTAPTALRALGLDEPTSMNGQPMSATGERPALARAVADLDEANTRAIVHNRTTGDFFWILVLVSAVVVGLGLLTLGGWRAPRYTPQRLRDWWARRQPSIATRNRLRRFVRPVCLAAASLPVATYLASAVPWQDGGAPRTALAGSVAVLTALVTLVASLGPWRRRRLGPAVAVLVVTLVTLLGDVVTGSHLELDGLLGYDAIVAGRFTGYGNLTFGLLAVSGLLLTAGLAVALARRSAGGGRRQVLLVTLVVGVVVTGLIGAPSLGRDFGGVLAAVPGFLLLAMLLAGIRVTVVRLVAVLGVAVLAVGTVAVLDWRQPPAERSHLGRFVAQLVDGQAWTVVSRKAEANLGILVGSPLSWTLAVALVAALWLLRPGGLLRSRPVGSPGDLPAADVLVLRAALVATALSLTIAAAVNDSGVAVPATAATLLVPLLVWLAAAPRRLPDGDAAAAADDGGAAGDRVSVSARGSTG